MMIDLSELSVDVSALEGVEVPVKCELLRDISNMLRQAEKDAARYKEIITDCRGVFVIAGDAEMVSAIDEAVK